MSKRRFSGVDDNPFDGKAQDFADAAVYGDGEINLQASKRIVTKPIDLTAIRPDFRQPRRVLPRDVQGDWDGSPDEIDDILISFHEQAENDIGKDIPISEILNGRVPKDWQVPESDMDSPVFSAYAKILNLAQNIKADGLLNPISVWKMGGGYCIETGERRWWAYQLLAHYVSRDDWGKIAAREVEYDPFRQSSENNARAELNAIGMARQVAILGMAILNHKFEYSAYEDIVLNPAADDRRYYKQWANGNVHKIEHEADKQRIQQAVGGLSWSRVSQYRSLLALTGHDVVDDAIWVAADAGNWADRAIRELRVPRAWDDAFTKGYVESLERTVNYNNWDYEDLILVRKSYDERFNMLKLEKAAQEKAAAAPALSDSPIDKATMNSPDSKGGGVSTLSSPEPDVHIPLGATVRTRVGHVGKVVGQNGRYFVVMVNGRTNEHKAETLTVISDSETPSVLRTSPPNSGEKGTSDSASEKVTYPDESGNAHSGNREADSKNAVPTASLLDPSAAPDGEGEALGRDELDKLLLLDSDIFRKVLSADLTKAIVASTPGVLHDDDLETAVALQADIKRLLMAKVGDFQRDELVALLDNVCHLSDIVSAMVAEARDEHFRVVLEAMEVRT